MNFEQTKSELLKLQNTLNSKLSKDKLSIIITYNHFIERFLDERNKPSLTIEELNEFFDYCLSKHGKDIITDFNDTKEHAQIKLNSFFKKYPSLNTKYITDHKIEGLFKYKNINVPFILEEHDNKYLLKCKTIQRKINFKTNTSLEKIYERYSIPSFINFLCGLI